MKKISIMFLLLSLSALVSCNSGGGSSPVSVPVKPVSDLSGTVSSVLNFMNPISSAYAADQICTTPGGSNKGVQIYLVDKGGNEKIICYANLNSNGSFNAKIREDLIPSDSQLKIKASVGGAVREAIVNTGSLSAISVDPASTLAVPVIHDQWVKGNDFDAKEIRNKVKAFVKDCVGSDVSGMKADKIASLKYMFENSKDSFEKTLFNHGADSAMDASFKAFLGNVYRSSTRLGADGHLSDPGALVYNDENTKALDESLNQIAKKSRKK
jgi:hypothetical protein